jgi:hypothetical protein
LSIAINGDGPTAPGHARHRPDKARTKHGQST